MKTCSICNTEFTPSTPMQKTCSFNCSKEQCTKKRNSRTTNKNSPQTVNKNNKQKAVKLSTLVNKTDRVMSEFIRRKNADDHGYCKCISCGRIFRWQEMDNGHFISRRHFATRYVEENCHPECHHCNRFNPDHLIGYTQSMIDLYDKTGIKWLQERSKVVLSPQEKRRIVMDALEEYSKKLEDLNNGI